jgi:hypothetical protein
VSDGQEIEQDGPDPVEEAGETTAADLIPTPVDTRPVGEGTTADVEGDGEAG